MSNSSRPPIETTLEKKRLLDFLDEGHVSDWFSRNKQYLMYGLIAVLAVFIIGYRLSNTHTNEVEQDYIHASNDFSVFAKTPNLNDPTTQASFDQLKSSMQSHPELHAAYDALIAQILLNHDQVNQAMPFATETLARTKVNHLSYYTDYAAASLLISQKKFQEALDKTLALQQEMGQAINKTEDTPRTFNDELFAINLLRIAMLQQLLGNKSAELQTWQLWQQYAGLKEGKSPLPVKIHPQAFRVLNQQLNVGSISLADYISYRESINTAQ